MKYSKDQDYFIKKALEGGNIFLSGKAGTGKSFIVKELISKLQNKGKNVICVAPTGIAAINIGGQTIHSLFSIPVDGTITFEVCRFLKPAKRAVMQKCDTIIIDEISMLRADVLDGIDLTLKKNRLGGLKNKQIIFVGDLKQLPVVVNKNIEAILFSEGYDDFSFLGAKIYNSLNVECIELQEILRQTDKEFIENLNIIREGGKSSYFKKFVNKEAKGVILAPYNASVQEYNRKGIESYTGQKYEFKATYTGLVKESDFPFENTITVRNGCPIMYLVNDNSGTSLRNGTIGKFYMIDNTPTIEVDGIKYILQKETISKKEYVYDQIEDKLVLKEMGSCVQYPIKLAFVLSIHKSQGLTFKEVTVDLTRPCFIKGQMYVALSRVTSPKGLRLLI